MSSRFWHGINVAFAISGALTFLLSLTAATIHGEKLALLALALFYILLSICAGTARDRAARREWFERAGRNLPADPEARRDQLARAPKAKRWF